MAKPGLEPRNLAPKPTRLPQVVLFPVLLASESPGRMHGQPQWSPLSKGRTRSASALWGSGAWAPGPSQGQDREWAVQSWQSVRLLTCRDPWPAEATSLISVASDQAGPCGEESRHFHWECRGQTGFCIAPSPVPAEFPEIAAGPGSLLGAAAGEFHPQPHITCDSEPTLLSTLERWSRAPRVASLPAILPGFSASQQAGAGQ